MIRADAPLEIVPMYVRGGAIIPMWPEMNYVGEKAADPVTFEIYPDDKGNALTVLYDDDGVSPAYKQSVHRYTGVRVSLVNRIWGIIISPPQGSYKTGARNFVFNLKGVNIARAVTLDGTPLNPLRAGATGVGWFKDANGISIRIADDGTSHQIDVK
jgi:alpha-glucosidase (family GH31 glycosyl hydrolase)